MATQADTLTLAAQVVDQFSAPLRDLTKQLKAFSSLEQTTGTRGKRIADDHWKSYRDLSKQVTETASSTKKLLTPAIEALGVTSLATIGSIGGMTAAVKAFAGSAKELSYLSKETGQSINQLRLWEAVGKRVGAPDGAVAAGFQKLAAGLEQARNNRGTLLTELRGSMNQEVRDLAEKLRNSKTDAEGLALIFGSLGKFSEQGKKKVLEAAGFPAELSRATQEMIEGAAKRIGTLTEDMRKNLVAAQDAMDDLRESVEGLSTAISGKLAKSFAVVTEGLSNLISEHPKIAAVAASIASIAASWGILKGGGAVLRGVLGSGAGAAVADAAGAAGAAAAPGIIGSIGGGVGSAGRFGLAGLGAWGLYELALPRPLLEGEDELARQRRYGVGEAGRGHRALMARGGHEGLHPISGAFADIAQGYRGEESIYKGTLKGSREGVIQAFQQILRDRQAGGGGAGGGITQAAYHPGEGGGAGGPGGAPSQDSGSGGVTGAGEPSMTSGGHAAQRAILSGHVKEFAKTIRERLGGQPGGSVMDMIKTAAGGDKKIESAMQSIFSGESSHGSHYDIGDKANGPAYGPFQLNVGKGRLGDIFQKETGLDLRDPSTIGAQAKWVAKHLREKFAKNQNYNPGSEWMGYGHRPGQTGGGMAPEDALRNAGAAPGVRGSAAAAASFAESMQGLKDHDAAGHAAITQYLRTGGAGMDPATVSWCGAFVSSSMHKAGISGPAGFAVATNWARWGTHVDPANARRGDVFVNMKGRPPGQLGGHVGLVTGPESGGYIPTIEGDVRAPGGGHMVRAVSERIREGLEIRRPPVGLDANARKHFGPATVKHEGHARVSVDFRGMPRGVKVAAGKPEGIFKEVRVDRGRAGTVADTG